jgi:hypothetical protein
MALEFDGATDADKMAGHANRRMIQMGHAGKLTEMPEKQGG